MSEEAKKEYHEVVHLFPKMNEEEFAQLCEDIKLNGLLEPIWTEPGTGKIIDGRHRYEACQKLGIKPKFREYRGPAPLVEFVMSINLRRRHLSPSQCAIVGRKALPMLKAEADARKKAGVAPEEPSKSGDSRDKAGELAGVSGKMIDAASALVEHAAPELEAAVASGEVSLSAAAEVAKSYSKEEQAEIAAGGKKAVSAAAKAAKKRKAIEAEAAKPKTEEDVDKVLQRILDLLNGYSREQVERIASELQDYAAYTLVEPAAPTTAAA